MKRRTLALLALATLAALAGCAGFGGGLDEERLAQNASYDWDTTADVTVTVEGDEYQAVYEVENGTGVNASPLEVQEADSRVVIRPPAEKGKLAYSAPADAGWFGLPVTVAGSYEVVLPPGRRVGNPVFGDVSPGDYEVSTDDQDRVHLRWSSLEDGSIAVRSYLQRDLYLFGGLLALLALVSVGGVVYYRIQIRRLERRREEAGLDVDLERDDDSDGPPLR